MSLKNVLLLILLMPALNFIHESGHWLGAKAVGLNPKMMLQRVDTGDYESHSSHQTFVYNWSGPAVNYVVIGSSFFVPQLLPVAFLMTAHRLGPNIFASALYLKGSAGFTNDETKLFPAHLRVFIAIGFSIFYLFLIAFLLRRWRPHFSFAQQVIFVSIFTLIWFGYGVSLDLLDQRLFQ